MLTGDVTAYLLHQPNSVLQFATDGVVIRECDLMIPTEQKSWVEGAAMPINPRERSTLLNLVGVMAMVCYGHDALEHHYETAAKLQDDAEAIGPGFSREIAAQKLKEASGVVKRAKEKMAA